MNRLHMDKTHPSYQMWLDYIRYNMVLVSNNHVVGHLCGYHMIPTFRQYLLWRLIEDLEKVKDKIV